MNTPKDQAAADLVGKFIAEQVKLAETSIYDGIRFASIFGSAGIKHEYTVAGGLEGSIHGIPITGGLHDPAVTIIEGEYRVVEPKPE